MPFGDGTGPMGMGPMTGRGGGFCAGFGMPGFANPMPGRGWGGFGRRIPYGYPYAGGYGAPYGGYGYPYAGGYGTPYGGYGYPYAGGYGAPYAGYGYPGAVPPTTGTQPT
jgi:hypothetical protein